MKLSSARIKGLVFVLIILCVFAGLMTLGSFYDIIISETMYNPESVFAEIMSFLGKGSAFMIIPYCIIIAVLWILEFTGKRRFEDKRRWIEIAAFWAIYLVMAAALAYIAKICWGRIRYYELLQAGDSSLFTQWYEPQGNTGHDSFFSGHTILSGSALVLFYCFNTLKDKEKANYQYTVLVVCILFMAVTAVSRIMLGMHFLTDVTFAGFLGILIFYIDYSIMPFVKKLIDKACLKIENIYKNKPSAHASESASDNKTKD